MFGAAVLLAGTSQLAAIELADSGGGVLMTALVVALINVRFVFYGAGVAGWFSDLPVRRRMLLAVPIVDQSFMICQTRFEAEEDTGWRQSYYLTATVVLVVTFLSCQLVAFHLGASFPDALGLHMAAPLAFVGMLATSINDRQALTAAVVAGTTTVLGSGVAGPAALPFGVALGVMIAMAGRS